MTGRLSWHEWGIDTQDLGDFPKGEHPVLDDREVWASVNPAMGIRLREASVADERTAMSDGSFARERLGMWPALEEYEQRVIPEDRWQACSDPASVVRDPVAFGLEVTPRRVASIGLAGLRTDGLPHVELVEQRDGTGWVVDRLVDLVEAWKPLAVVLDSRGHAASLISALSAAGLHERGREHPRGVLVTTTGAEYAQACGAILDHVLEGRLRHLDEERLNDAAAGVKKRPIGDGFGWDRRDPEIEIGPWVSVTLALFGHSKQPARRRSVYEDRGLSTI